MTTVIDKGTLDLATVGGRVKSARLNAGLSQRQLADACGPGVTAAYVSRIEANDRNPSVRALRRIAEASGVSSVWLETGAEPDEFDPETVLREVVEIRRRLALRHARARGLAADLAELHERTLRLELVLRRAPSEPTSSVPADDDGR